MTKTTQATRISALEATVAGQAESIKFLLERIERLTGRIERVKRWSRQHDQAIGEMPERAARYIRSAHDLTCLQRTADAGHIPESFC